MKFPSMLPVNLSVEERMKLLYIIATLSKRKTSVKRKEFTYQMFKPFAFTPKEREGINVDGLTFSVDDNQRRWFLVDEGDYLMISNMLQKSDSKELDSLKKAFHSLELATSIK